MWILPILFRADVSTWDLFFLPCMLLHLNWRAWIFLSTSKAFSRYVSKVTLTNFRPCFCCIYAVIFLYVCLAELDLPVVLANYLMGQGSPSSPFWSCPMRCLHSPGRDVCNFHFIHWKFYGNGCQLFVSSFYYECFSRFAFTLAL